MTPPPDPADQKPSACPFCSGPVERGCLYGGDKTGLRWLDGEPSWEKNFSAAFADGIPVGHHEFLAGTYATGLRCSACRKIVLHYERN